VRLFLRLRHSMRAGLPVQGATSPVTSAPSASVWNRPNASSFWVSSSPNRTGSKVRSGFQQQKAVIFWLAGHLLAGVREFWLYQGLRNSILHCLFLRHPACCLKNRVSGLCSVEGELRGLPSDGVYRWHAREIESADLSGAKDVQQLDCRSS
jgi:hypothetical protein